MIKAIYPEINIDSAAIKDNPSPIGELSTIRYFTRITTFLRKKHNGKWYLIYHMNEATSYKSIEDSKYLALRDLSYNIFGSINFCKINPKELDLFGNLVYTLDSYQGSELERFKHLRNKK